MGSMEGFIRVSPGCLLLCSLFVVVVFCYTAGVKMKSKSDKRNRLAMYLHSLLFIYRVSLLAIFAELLSGIARTILLVGHSMFQMNKLNS